MKLHHLIVACCTLLLCQHLYADNIIIADRETKIPLKSAVASVWTENADAPITLKSDAAGCVRMPEKIGRLTVKKYGYEDKEIKNCSLSAGDTVFMTPGYILHEVSVSAIGNYFRMKPDSYVYDVSADSALIGKSTLDALGRIPILNVTINGDVSSMQGKNLVYKVNGLTNPLISGDLQTALRALKADHVKRIELVDNPTGNDPNTLEINIITKGRLEGYQAMATERLSDYSWGSVLWGLTKINKFCVSGSYAYTRLRDHDGKSYTDETRETSDGKILLNRASTYGGYRAHLNNVEVSMSYDIDDYTVLNAYGRVLSKSNPYKLSHSETVIRSGAMSELVAYNQSDKSTFDDKEYSASLNFEKLYGENARNGKLYIGYEFYKRPNDILTQVRYDVTQCNEPSLLPTLEAYNRRERIDLTMHTLTAEYRRHFLKRHTVFAYATYRFRSNIDNDSIGDNISRIALNQHLAEGSVAYKYAADKLSVQGGIGAKFYDDDISNSKLGPEYSFSRRSFILQPTLSMTFVPNYKSRYELAYAQTSMIPDIQVMNPFVFQDEPTRVSYGNPHLSPEKNYRLALSANYNFDKAYIGATLSGQYSSDLILQYSFLDNSNVLNTTYDNIARRWSYGASAFMTWNISRNTRLRTNLSLDYIDYRSRKLNADNSGLQFSGRLTLEQQLPFDIYGELRGSYNTPWINLQGKGGENYGYGIGLSRRFLSNQLRVSLNADNFVPTYYSRTYTTQSAGFAQTQRNRNFHAYYSLTVSYSFGNIRARVKETESSISNDDIKSSYDE